MADSDVISPTVQKLSVLEAQALADRLFSRSQSTLFVAPPEVRRDLCMASRAIRSMLSAIDRLASKCSRWISLGGRWSGIRAARCGVFCLGIHSRTVGSGKEMRNRETYFFSTTFPTRGR